MKVILREDVAKLGEAGTVQNVADGFARNYLIPQGLAVLATPGELKTMANNQRVKDIKIAKQEADLKSLSEQIDGLRLEFEAKAGETGRLFGSITAADIAEKVSAVVGTEIDRRKVQITDSIRTSGEHTVAIHLVGRLRPTVVVVVNTGEEAEPEAASEESAASVEEVAAEAVAEEEA